MNKKQVLLLVKRYILAFFCTALIITVSILAYEFGPSPYIYNDDDWEDLDPIKVPSYNESLYNVILDHHSHTYYSDGVLSVKQNIEWHIAMGYNAIIITDHDTLANKNDIDDLRKEYKKDGVIIIQGMEWTTDRIHMNFLGIDKWDDPTPKMPTDKEIQEAIDEVHDQNGVVVVNHIPWSKNYANMDDHPSRNELFDWGVDYIEIVNGVTYDKNSVEWYEDLSPAEQSNIGYITGTDMHSPWHIHGWTFLNATELTEDAIMDELRALRTNISYSSEAYEAEVSYDLNPGYILLSPLMKFGWIFRSLWTDSLDWIGTFVILGYFTVIFAISEVLRARKQKGSNREKKLTNNTTE